ncbi:hypothetical protein D9611_007267 [Ephemerocybe angulata]|uniref:Uncharacterized protein n=1 Tax=Ephemerocybe angulata TaxID=980116 RepID=A0A8H5EWI5_9AGAR|nr:hypothetical protein D9611_007267 [Tulosesus angulatus]
MVQINFATSLSVAALASVAIVNALPIAPQDGSFEIAERGFDSEVFGRDIADFSELDARRFGFLRKFRKLIPSIGGGGSNERRELDLEDLNELAAREEMSELDVRRFGFLRKFRKLIPSIGGGGSNERRELDLEDLNELAAREEMSELDVRRFGFLRKFRKLIPSIGGGGNNERRDMEDDLELRDSELEEIEELLARFYGEESWDEMD